MNVGIDSLIMHVITAVGQNIFLPSFLLFKVFKGGRIKHFHSFYLFSCVWCELMRMNMYSWYCNKEFVKELWTSNWVHLQVGLLMAPRVIKRRMLVPHSLMVLLGKQQGINFEMQIDKADKAAKPNSLCLFLSINSRLIFICMIQPVDLWNINC